MSHAKTKKPSKKLVDHIMEKEKFKIKINSILGDGKLSFRTSIPNILRNFVQVYR
jgi:hypothetical protein